MREVKGEKAENEGIETECGRTQKMGCKEKGEVYAQYQTPSTGDQQ